MLKNVAGQTISVQMITAADGSAFTGAVSVAVEKDGGGDVAGAGTGPTHVANGKHRYTPTQDETNADHISFTFTGTGAIPVTHQVYTLPAVGATAAAVAANLTAIQLNLTHLNPDWTYDAVTDPANPRIVVKQRGTSNVLSTKLIKDAAGNPATALTTPAGGLVQA